MGDDPEKCNAIRNADEKPPAPADDSKKGKEHEEVEKSDWLGPARKTEKESSESQKITREVLIQPTPPKERDDSQKAISQAPRPKEEKHSKSKLGSLEVERAAVDKGMADYIDEAAERTLSELQNEPWYHGALPLEDIGALVAEPGSFLIRELEPEEGRIPMPCLTVRFEGQLKDYPIHAIQVEDSRQFTIDGKNTSKTVVGLVQKHYEEKLPLPDEALLVKPVPKQPWELTKDKIKLITKLGEGAFGEVWQGTLRQSATQTVQAAIKVTKLKEDNKKYMQELFKEARLMRQYQHINVVAFFGMVMENENVMIVMEMVNGGGLDHYLKKNVVSIADKCSYAFDVALGLYYLHSKRCMHRDLACRNCLIDTQKNIVKISDFGLSKQADTYKIQPTEKIPTKWQAPEVVATHVYTRECDVYSYGILVWEIFNNAKMPFEEYDNKTVRHRLSDPTFRPKLSDDLPDEIRVVVTACWSAAPDSRPVMKDVAWILKRFQKHKTKGSTLKQLAPPNPAAKPVVAPPNAQAQGPQPQATQLSLPPVPRPPTSPPPPRIATPPPPPRSPVPPPLPGAPRVVPKTGNLPNIPIAQRKVISKGFNAPPRTVPSPARPVIPQKKGPPVRKDKHTDTETGTRRRR
ncbi:hypothetical protein V3C99_007770 [Haemonchus contortus]